MSTIITYLTSTTTLETLLRHFKTVPEGDIDAVVKFMNKQLGLTYISDLVELDWDGDIFSLVSFSSHVNKEGGKVRLTSAIHCLKVVEKFHILQGIESTIFLPSTFFKLKTLLPLIEKGMENILTLQEVKFPRNISHKNWIFLKRDITEILTFHGLDWTLTEDALLSPKLSIGVCYWFRKNIYNSNYEHLSRGPSSHEVWKALISWFSTSELISGRKAYLKGQLDEVRLDSVGSIEEFINKYTLLIEELTEIKEVDSSMMQSNASRIEDVGVQAVGQITKALAKIYVNVHGSKVFDKKKSKNSKTNVRRVESGDAEPKMHSNYLGKKDYAKLSSKLNDQELEEFHKTRVLTKKIKRILREDSNDEGEGKEDQVKVEIITSSSTDPKSGKRQAPASKVNSQGSGKKARKGKPNSQPA